MKTVCFTLSFLLMTASVQAADWPQFRGPGGSGVSPEKNLPFAWTATNNIRWKQKLPGKGLSNPVIAEGRIFVTAASGWQQKRLHVLCFDEKTGKQLWERQFWATGTTHSHPKTNMAAPTPVTDGKHIYALFATQDIAALDRDGNLLWFRSLTGDYPNVGNNVGMASSPILWKDVLILAVETDADSFALGIDKKTGENRWRVPRPKGINWVTPVLTGTSDKAQVLFQSGEGLAALDPATGKNLWKVEGKLSPIPSPVIGDGTILAPGGKFTAIQPPKGDKKAEVAWQSPKLQCGYASPLYHNGKIYTLATRGIFRCADAANGNVLWDLRLDGDFAASPVLADGKVYLVNEEGTCYVVDAAKPAVVSSNPMADKILATPAIANGAIYLRSDGYLYCVGKKE